MSWSTRLMGTLIIGLALCLFIGYVIRRFLDSRYHLKFDHLGFFSIKNLRYETNDKEKLIQALGIGAVKIRMKRPGIGSAPWITIQVSDTHLSLGDFTENRAFNSNPSRPNMLNKRLSMLHASIKHSSWWYSLSAVKSLLQLTSVIPAQLIMSGLANYVEVQINRTNLQFKDICLSIDQLCLQSTLFAGLAATTTTTTISVSLQDAHPRHSLKCVDHLFREKLLEIAIHIGTVRLISQGEEALCIPLGSRLSILHRLSAACIPFKEMDVHLQLEATRISIDAMLDLSKRWRKRSPQQTPTTKSTQKRKAFSKSFSFSVDNLSLLYCPLPDVCSTVHFSSVSANASLKGTETSVVYHGDMRVRQAICNLSNGLPTTASISTPLLRVPLLELTATTDTAGSEIENKDPQVVDKLRTSSGGGSDSGRLNTSHLIFSCQLKKPVITIDMDACAFLKNIQWKRDKQGTPASIPASIPASNHVHIPSLSLSINVTAPSLQFIVQKKVDTMSTMEYVLFELSGNHVIKNNRISSTPSSPTQAYAGEGKTDPSSPLRKRRSTLPWSILFQKNWQNKEKDESIEAQEEAEREREREKKPERNWIYAVSVKSTVHKMALIQSSHHQEAVTDSKPFLSFENTICASNVHLDTAHLSQGMVIKDIKTVNIDIDIENLVLNTWVKIDETPAYVYLMNTLVNPWRNPHTSAYKKPLSLSWLRMFKVSLVVSELSFLFETTDKSTKDIQKVEGYINNGPKEDIMACFVSSVKKVSMTFHGAHIGRGLKRGSHRYNRSMGSIGGIADSEATATETLLGAVKCSIQSIAIKNAFRCKGQPRPSLIMEDAWHLLIWMSRANATVDIHFEENRVGISTDIILKKTGIFYSLENHYACLLALQALKEIKNCFPQQPSSGESSQSQFSLQRVQCQFNRNDIKINLPNNIPLYLRIDGLVVLWKQSASGEPPIVSICNTKLLVTNTKQNMWEQLIEVDNLHLSLSKSDGSRITQLNMTKFYIRVPYRFLLADVVDNILNLLKAIKILRNRLSHGNSLMLFGPQAKFTPVSVPSVSIKCDILALELQDDPFEARLRMIWRTGLDHQTNRIALEDAFEAKAQTFLNTAEDTVSKGIKTNTTISDAWQGLQSHNSKSWIKHINSMLEKERTAYDTARRFDYCSPEDESADSLYDTADTTLSSSSLFHISILPLPPSPPLLNFTLLQLAFSIRSPDFPIEQTRQFVHTNGKGIPLDTEFSSLVPFHVDLQASKTWAQLRDYPLPLMHVPPTTSSTCTDSPAWSLSGDYVIGDELGSLEATRCVCISITPKGSYTVDVSRTSTPPKIYSIVDIKVHTQSMTSFCWSVSYQPAIQDVSRALENITRPPVDPSPKVGFWDKIRLSIHTRSKIEFIGGGDFAFVIKGTRNPYEMSTEGFGLAKVWSHHVQWFFGHENPQGEFMQITSDDYAFGVPDLICGGYAFLDLLPKGYPQYEFNSIPSAYLATFCHRDQNTSTKQESFHGVKDEQKMRFTKIALKLSGGIRMGIGCHLERICAPVCDECQGRTPESRKCRFLHFLPHYKVKFKTLDAVKALANPETYDAYAGFRSQFIHLSISIVKLNIETNKETPENVAMNSIHLSNLFIEHFLAWARLFGGGMSYPIRYGTLYPRIDKRPNKQFGKHISTVKYKIVAGPLMIGYFYKDEKESDSVVSMDEIGDVVGLKALVSHFSVDMHQRRTIVNTSEQSSSPPQETLIKQRMKANWPLHEAEVQFKNVDLRAVRAKYIKGNPLDAEVDMSRHHRRSVDSSSIESSISGSESNGPDYLENWNDKLGEDDTPPEWVDFDDFVELYLPTPMLLPKVQVLPFAFSPCIYYLKQNSRDDAEKYQYLHGTHDCIIGTAMETREVQMALLRERSDNIDLQIRKHQARLHSVESKLYGCSDNVDLLNESYAIVQKTEILFEKRNILQRYLRELSTQSMPDVAHNARIDSDAYSSSMIFGRDSLMRWEQLMGYFKQRYIIHNAQILWNNSVRNVIYHFLDVQAHKRALSYYMSSRTVKFLRDMTETQDQNQYENLYGPNDDMECHNIHQITQELIDRLLSEQDTHFYAENETEDGSNNSGDQNNIRMTDENVNDPDVQMKGIPSGYSIKSNYIVDLLNPQINLQSDANSDSLVLMSSERMQIKGLNIMDNNDTEAEMDLVKSRTIVSIDNTQFFVAKKEHFDTVDLLLDNHYGAGGSDHWLAWIPPEILVSYVKQSDKFQRVGNRLMATVQYDKHNALRMKPKSSSIFSQTHPFEDRCDTVRLNFPKLALTANSQQYNAMYEVIVDLLLYKEPAKKERLNRLREISMAAEKGNLFETTKKIVNLQNRIRHLVHTRQQYRLNRLYLGERQIEDFNIIQLTLHELEEELYLTMEAVKSIQNRKKSTEHEPTVNLKVNFSAECIIWEMLTDNDTPLSEWNLKNTNFLLINKDDHSSSNTLEVDLLHVTNRTVPPVFKDIIGPYTDSRKMVDFSRQKMLRCYVASLAPVGGIPVIQHLEINLSPVRVMMTYDFGKLMASYFFPPERRQKQPDAVGTISLTSGIANSTTPTNSNYSENESNLILDKHVDKELTRCSFTKHQDSGKVNNTESAKTIDIGSLSARDSGEYDAVNETPSPASAPPTTGKKQGKNSKRRNLPRTTTDDLSVMKKRASSNRAFILVKIPGAKHCLSYQGPKEKNIEDLRDFVFQQPTLEYRNKTWSWFELVSNIKKDFMRAAVLHNSTALLKEKLTIRRHPRDVTKFADSPSSTSAILTFNAEDTLSLDSSFRTHGSEEIDDASEANESSHEEDHEADKDNISIHSAGSNDNGWEADSLSETKPTRRTILWSRRFKKNKHSTSSSEITETGSLPIDIPMRSEEEMASPKSLSINNHSIGCVNASPRSYEKFPLQPLYDEDIVSKGKILFGKYYIGQHQNPTSRLKGKLPQKPSSVRSSKSSNKNV
ncbi:golgi-body localization protein domain-containing protein [Spinellus fusiger]|nr:golgi-body localization protein domain-containing protein [Spinellus fusiger]